MSGQRPTHHLFAVMKPARDGAKGYWQRIGAAWPHQDGDGFSLRLELLPLAGQDVVLRRIKDETERQPADGPRDEIPF